MATTLNVTSNFKGEAAGEIIGSIFKEAQTIKNGVFSVIPNIVGSAFLQKTRFTGSLKDYNCMFDPQGVIDLTEVELHPKKLQLDLEVCKEKFRSRWSAAQMGFSAWNDQVPANEQEALMLEIGGSVSSQIESSLWYGVQATSGQFAGFITLASADSAVTKITGATVSPANVIAELGKVLDATRVEITNRPDFKFVVSTNVKRAYVRALNAGNYAQDPDEFEGFKLTVIDVLANNTMATFVSDHVSFGTGLESDLNEVRVLDMTDVTLSDQYRIGMKMTAGLVYIDGAEIVLYKQ